MEHESKSVQRVEVRRSESKRVCFVKISQALDREIARMVYKITNCTPRRSSSKNHDVQVHESENKKNARWRLGGIMRCERENDAVDKGRGGQKTEVE